MRSQPKSCSKLCTRRLSSRSLPLNYTNKLDALTRTGDFCRESSGGVDCMLIGLYGESMLSARFASSMASFWNPQRTGCSFSSWRAVERTNEAAWRRNSHFDTATTHFFSLDDGAFAGSTSVSGFVEGAFHFVIACRWFFNGVFEQPLNHLKQEKQAKVKRSLEQSNQVWILIN